MQMNYKRKQESYKHKIKDGGYSRKERNVVRKNVLVWMFVSRPQNAQIEITFPKVMVLGGRSGLWEVIRL